MSDEDETGGEESPPLQLVFTHFPAIDRPQGESQVCSWQDVVDTLRAAPEFESKVDMPLFRLARFEGDRRGDGALREVYGLTVDYDGERLPITDAAMMASDRGVSAFFYSSPSSARNRPRWRGVFPLSKAYPPADLERLTDLANGVLGGVLAHESWTHEQAFYYGRPAGGIYDVQQVNGTPIDRVLGIIPIPNPRRGRAALTPAPAPQMGKRLEPEQIVHLRGALKYWDHDDYHEWVEAGLCLRAYGAQGYELWSTWSAQSEKMPDDKAMRAKWSSFNDDKGMNNAGPPTIFARAQERGYLNPASALQVETERREREMKAIYQEALQRAKRSVTIADRRQIQGRPFPVRELEDMAQWIGGEHAKKRVHPFATIGTVLAVASLCASRNFVADDGSPIPLQMIMITPNVAWASYAWTGADVVATAVGAGAAVHLERLGSTSALLGALARTPAVLYAPKDWGEQLTFRLRQTSSALQGVHSYISATLPDGHDMRLESWAEFGAGSLTRANDKGTMDRPIIYKPCLTLFAAMGGRQAGHLLKASEIERGALDPVLALPMSDVDAWINVTRRREAGRRLPPAVVTRARAVMGINTVEGSALPENPFADLYSVPPTPRRVATDCADLDAAIARLRDIGVKMGKDGRDAMVLQTIVGAGIGALQRIVCVLAAWQNPGAPAVEAAHVAWAEWLIAECVLAMIADHDLRGAEEEKVLPYEATLEAIKRRPAGISKRDLTRMCKPFRNLGDAEKRDAMIADMISAGLVEEVADPRGVSANGKPVRLLIHADHATVVECASPTPVSVEK